MLYQAKGHSLKDHDDIMAWQYKLTFLIQSNNSIDKYYNDMMSKKATMPIEKEIAKSNFFTFDSF